MDMQEIIVRVLMVPYVAATYPSLFAFKNPGLYLRSELL